MGYVLRLNAETFPMSEEERAVLADAGLKVREIEGFDAAEIIANAPEADAVMICSTYLPKEVIDHLGRCRIVSRLGTGTDKIDRAELTRRGIYLTNLPDFCTDEVADHTLSLLLYAARQLPAEMAAMRAGHRSEGLYIRRLSRQTAGIVGFGRIARAIARRLRGFGFRILACDPHMDGAAAAELGVTPADFDAVLAEADFLCLACPFTGDNRGMIGREELAKMKSSAVLVNTARGELIDEPALAAALRRGTIRYACCDVYGGINVFAPEGFPTTHEFFSTPNLALTPHCAAYSRESMEESRVGGALAVVDVLAGRPPKHPVNPEVQPWFLK